MSVGFAGRDVVVRRHIAAPTLNITLTVYVATISFQPPPATDSPTQASTSPQLTPLTFRTSGPPGTGTGTPSVESNLTLDASSPTSTSTLLSTTSKSISSTAPSDSTSAMIGTSAEMTLGSTISTNPQTETVDDEEEIANKEKLAAIVGGAVGGGAVLLVIIAGAVFCACRARRSRSSESQTPTPLSPVSSDISPQNGNSMQSIYAVANFSTYDDAGDVRASAYGDLRVSGTKYDDVGDVRTLSGSSMEYNDVGDVRATD